MTGIASTLLNVFSEFQTVMLEWSKKRGPEKCGLLNKNGVPQQMKNIVIKMT
jgi:hypothetical protein